MLGRDMVVGRRYIDNKNRKFKAKRRVNGGFIVIIIRKRQINKDLAFVRDDYEVKPLRWGKNRVKKQELDNIIEHIKQQGWYKEKKRYIMFMQNGVLLRIEYVAQKVLTRHEINNIPPNTKYKNGYYAYDLADLKDYIVKMDIKKTEDIIGTNKVSVINLLKYKIRRMVEKYPHNIKSKTTRYITMQGKQNKIRVLYNGWILNKNKKIKLNENNLEKILK